jgi:CheY-like chemotaxis protein
LKTAFFTYTGVFSDQRSVVQKRAETFRVPALPVGRLPEGHIMKTILVLEDDPSNMQVLCALLWSSGYYVLEATTGKEALEALNHENGRIDLFISDLAVPGASGTEVALELNKSSPATPVLFVSGSPMYTWNRRDLQNFQRLPSNRVDFLEKPFGASTLLDRIGELIGGRANHEPKTTATPTFCHIG